MGDGLKRYWSLLGGLAGLAILAGIFYVNIRLKGLGLKPVGTPAEALLQEVGLAWLWTAALLVAFLALVGIAVNQRPAGVIIDNRHRVSLSKFQAALWTVLVLSALITSAAARATVTPDLPPAAGGVLGFSIPPELLAAMGIALTTLVATPALLSTKTGNPPAATASLAATAAKTGRSAEMITSAGSVVGWRSAACAQWMDMFRGDEDSNAGAPDLSKVQQFLITLTLVGVYGGALWAGFVESDGKFLQGPKIWLPSLDSNFVWLLAISHAGYLAYKAAPHGRPGAGATPETEAEPGTQRLVAPKLNVTQPPPTTTPPPTSGPVG